MHFFVFFKKVAYKLPNLVRAKKLIFYISNIAIIEFNNLAMRSPHSLKVSIGIDTNQKLIYSASNPVKNSMYRSLASNTFECVSFDRI